MMTFEQYEKRHSISSGAYLNENLLNLHKQTRQLLEEAKRVLLFYDEERNAIGVVPASSTDERSLKMQANGTISSKGFNSAFSPPLGAYHAAAGSVDGREGVILTPEEDETDE